MQRLGQPPALRGLEPAAHAYPGVDQHDVRWHLQTRPGGRAQFGVVGDRDDAQRGGQHDPGAAVLQQTGELVPAAVRGDPDGVPGQRRGRLRQRRRGDDGPSRAPRALRHPRSGPLSAQLSNCSKSRGVAGRSTEGHARRPPSSASTRSHVTPAFSAVPPTGTRRGFSRPGRSPAGTVRSVLNPDGGSWVMLLGHGAPGSGPGPRRRGSRTTCHVGSVPPGNFGLASRLFRTC